MVDPRRGERLGWTLAWLGSGAWLVVAGVGGVLGGPWILGLAALALFALALALSRALAPWKHPRAKLWQLFLPLYAIHLVAVSVFLNVIAATPPAEAARMLFLLVFPALVPIAILGRRTWADGKAGGDKAKEFEGLAEL